MKEKVKATKSKAKIIIVASIIILIVLAIIIVPKIRTSINNRRAAEVKSALEDLRNSVDNYWKNNGSISGITLAGAVSDAKISTKTQDKWKFYIAWKETTLYTTEMVDKLKDVNVNQMVYVSPYRLIMAVATAKNPLREGTKTWFIGDTNSYHGFGVDEKIEPDWSVIFPNP